MLVEETTRSTCQKYKKHIHISPEKQSFLRTWWHWALLWGYTKLSFYCSIFTFARTVQYLFFHQGNYGYNFIINMGHISMPWIFTVLEPISSKNRDFTVRSIGRVQWSAEDFLSDYNIRGLPFCVYFSWPTPSGFWRDKMHLSIERIKTFPLTELFIVQNSAVYLNILSALCS